MSRVAGDQLRCQAVMRLQRLGRLSEAERLIEPTIENVTTRFSVAASNLAGGRIALEQGRLDLADERITLAWSLMQRTGGFQLIGPAMAARVLLDLTRGDLPGRAGGLANGWK